MNTPRASLQLLLPAMLLLGACSGSGPGNTVYDFDSDGVQDQDDCDPADPSIYPGADDPYGNGIDEDCDGADGDADDLDNDGEPNESDCDRNDPSIYPGADDPYGDGIDQNCDGNDGVDSDGDGYPAAGEGVPDELEDCNDADADIHPGAEENPNSSPDEDCDGFGRPLEVTIIPVEPRTADSLVLQITTDAVVYDVAWSVGGQPRPEYSGFTTISAGQTSRDELWTVQVLPYDAAGSPGEAATSSTTILNTAPEAALIVGLDPGPAEGDTVTTGVMVADADGDDIEVSNAWMVNAVQVNSDPSLGMLDSTFFDKGDEIWAVLTPNDGTEDGVPAETNHVFAINTIPSALSVAVDPAVGFETTVFNCEVTGWLDPDPADVEAYDFNWTVDGAVVSTSASIDGALFDRDQVLVCQATPNDGEAVGTTLTSAPVIVSNSPPSIAAAVVSPASPTETDTLEVQIVGWSDPDPGDVPASDVYQWFVDAGSGPVLVSNDPTLNGGSFDKGDHVYVEVTPNDGIEAGTPVASNIVTAVNTAPHVASVTLAPDPAVTGSTLAPYIDGWSDPDPGDPVLFDLQWWVNQTTDAGQTSSLDGSHFVKNDEVVIDFTPSDGQDAGATVSSPVLVIANTVPTAPVVGILPAVPTADDELICSIMALSSDPDIADLVDPALTYDFEWSSDSGLSGTWDQSAQPANVTANVPSSATSAGEIWSCAVSAWDSEDFGPYGSASVNIAGVINGSCRSVTDFGAGSYIDLGTDSSLTLPANEFTVEAWVNYAGHQGQSRTILSTWVVNGPASVDVGGYTLSVNGGGNLSFCYRKDHPTTCASTVGMAVPENQWMHVAGTYSGSADGSSMKLFLDGTEVAAGTGSTLPGIEGGERLTIGGMQLDYNGSYPCVSEADNCSWAGSIADVRISSNLRYDAPFSPDVVLVHDADTVGLWTFDAYTGATLDDDSGNGWTGTTVGTPTVDTVCPDGDVDGDGSPTALDCNDGDASIYPGATEVAGDGIDQDCDGSDSSGSASCTSISLNGTSDWVDVPDLSNGNAWTFEAWMDFDWAVGGYIFHSNCHQFDFNPSGRLSAHTYPGCNGTGTQKVMRLNGVDFSALPSGWQHVAVSTDGLNEASFFSNGTLIGTASVVSDNVSSVNNGGLGAHTDNGTANVFLEVAFSQVRISNSERYTAPFTPATTLDVDAATVAHYDFDDQSGNLVADSTGNYDATLISGTWQTECHFEDLDADGAPSWLDCDDDDDDVYPGATEICNDNVDNDCDGADNGCGWYEQTSGVTVGLNDLVMVSATTGYAVGDGGTILRTIDGGANWVLQSSGTTENLRSVHFASPTAGWVVGDSGTILRTVGGQTWSAQSSVNSGALYGVHSANFIVAYAVGDEGLIVKTVNGGNSWTDISSAVLGGDRLRDVVFGDAVTGWTVGHGSLSLGTTDAGANWALQSTPTSGYVWFGLDALDASNAWRCGQSGRLESSADGGATWVAATTGTTESINSVSFVTSGSAGEGWAVGDYGTILASVDGGVSFTPQTAPAGVSHLFAVAFTDTENGWAVGDNGVIIHTISGGSSAIDNDNDGVEASDDCDDSDANSTVVADDGDCDGWETADDCDDADPQTHPGSTVLTSALVDRGCDGVLAGEYGHSGAEVSVVVPSGVTEILLDARGASGGGCGSYEGGDGGRTTGTLQVTPGDTLSVWVGAQGAHCDSGGSGGFNGGGTGSLNRAGGGGGATDLRLGGNSLSNRVIVAGSGGGASFCDDSWGGDGGGLVGLAGGEFGDANGGGGGTQSAGGSGGWGCGASGASGSLGQGADFVNVYSCGGGGGYYGGGSSGSGCSGGCGGGGGGSALVPSGGTTMPGLYSGDGILRVYAFGADFSPGVSCKDILDDGDSVGDGFYWIDPDNSRAFRTWCDMTTDGGGWTTFFAGTNGAANVFAKFEDNEVVCTDPGSNCLRPIPATLTSSDELGVRCGSTMVKASMSADLLDYFANGNQHYWVPLASAVTIDGSLSSSADVSGFWTGTGGVGNPGWMVSDSGGLSRPSTFATSYPDSSYDYCNAVADSDSGIALSYREVGSSIIDYDNDGVAASDDCDDSDPNRWLSCPTCSSLDFDGVGDYVSIPDLDLGADFTVEMWVNFDAIESSPQATYLFTQLNSLSSCGSYNCLLFSLQDEGWWNLRWTTEPASSETSWQATGYDPVGQWHHIALTYDVSANERVLFVDGLARATSNPVSSYLDDPVYTFIGRGADLMSAYAPFDGQMSWFRASDSVRYSTDFAPTVEQTADADTLALYLFDQDGSPGLLDSGFGANHGTLSGGTWLPGTCVEDACDVDGDGALAYGCGGDDCDDGDANAYPGAQEVLGDAIDQDCDGIYDGCASIQIDGSGSPIVVDWASHLSASYQALTLEAWVAGQGSNNQGYLFSSMSSTHLGAVWWASQSGIGGGWDDGAWHHIAIVFDPVTQSSRYFVNGIETTGGGPYPAAINGFGLVIGGCGGNCWFNGQILGVRLSTIARYTENFTPSSNYGSDSDTVLFMPMSDGTLTDLGPNSMSVTNNNASAAGAGGYCAP